MQNAVLACAAPSAGAEYAGDASGGGGGGAGGDVAMVKRSTLAACLTCPLCGRLLRDAATITECLHTFCRKCISEEFINKEICCCPTCNIHLGCAPEEKLRVDHSIQYVRSKIFPFKRRKIEDQEVISPLASPVKKKERSLSSLTVHAPQVSIQKCLTKRRTKATCLRSFALGSKDKTKKVEGWKPLGQLRVGKVRKSLKSGLEDVNRTKLKSTEEERAPSAEDNTSDAADEVMGAPESASLGAPAAQGRQEGGGPLPAVAMGCFAEPRREEPLLGTGGEAPMTSTAREATSPGPRPTLEAAVRGARGALDSLQAAVAAEWECVAVEQARLERWAARLAASTEAVRADAEWTKASLRASEERLEVDREDVRALDKKARDTLSRSESLELNVLARAKLVKKREADVSAAAEAVAARERRVAAQEEAAVKAMADLAMREKALEDAAVAHAARASEWAEERLWEEEQLALLAQELDTQATGLDTREVVLRTDEELLLKRLSGTKQAEAALKEREATLKKRAITLVKNAGDLRRRENELKSAQEALERAKAAVEAAQRAGVRSPATQRSKTEGGAAGPNE